MVNRNGVIFFNMTIQENKLQSKPQIKLARFLHILHNRQIYFLLLQSIAKHTRKWPISFTAPVSTWQLVLSSTAKRAGSGVKWSLAVHELLSSQFLVSIEPRSVSASLWVAISVLPCNPSLTDHMSRDSLCSSVTSLENAQKNYCYVFNALNEGNTINSMSLAVDVIMLK